MPQPPGQQNWRGISWATESIRPRRSSPLSWHSGPRGLCRRQWLNRDCGWSVSLQSRRLFYRSRSFVPLNAPSKTFVPKLTHLILGVLSSWQKFDGWLWEISPQSFPRDPVLCQLFQFNIGLRLATPVQCAVDPAHPRGSLVSCAVYCSLYVSEMVRKSTRELSLCILEGTVLPF